MVLPEIFLFQKRFAESFAHGIERTVADRFEFAKIEDRVIRGGNPLIFRGVEVKNDFSPCERGDEAGVIA